MKKIILASISLLFGLLSFSQGTSTEKKTITENGITKSWTITKEFDSQGNLVNYDSTYSENAAPNSYDYNNQSTPFEKNDLFANPRSTMPEMDSVFDKMRIEMSQMMFDMNNMMNGLKMDSIFNEFKLSPGFESPLEQEELFKFPENQQGSKPKGTRT